MDKLIVAVDLSGDSEFALETAAIIAKRNNAELLVLHMLEINEAPMTGTDSEHNEKIIFFLKLAEQKFENFLNKDFLEGITVTSIVKHYKVFSEIAELAENHSIDMIVMGSHGTSGMSEIFVGSNTEKVVRYSDIPVLVVKEKPTDLNFDTVTFACDFSNEMVAPYLKARTLFDDLQLLYVNVPGASFKNSSEMEAMASAFLDKANGNTEGIDDIIYTSDYTIENGILNASSRIEADLIAVPTHGRKGLAHFFTGSISEDIANHAKLPVITFKI